MNCHLAFGQLSPVDPIAARALEQRVVHIGHVLHVANPHARRLDEANQHVVHTKGECVADVARVVGRDATHIEPKQLAPPLLTRLDSHLPPGQRVVDTQLEARARQPSL